MTTILEYMRNINPGDYDLNPPITYRKDIGLFHHYYENRKIGVRNFHSVHHLIRYKIKGLMDYHIVHLIKNGLIIGFNKEYLYLYYLPFGRDPEVILLKSEELNNDDLYLVLKYGKNLLINTD